MSKQPTSKRQWRDGAAPSAKKTAKPFKSKARPKDETRKTASKPYGQKVSDDLCHPPFTSLPISQTWYPALLRPVCRS